MKKLVSIMLCAVMVVFAALPCFAADAPTLTRSGDKTPFEAGNLIITKYFADYADQQTGLNNYTGGAVDHEAAGFSCSQNYDGVPVMTLWGGSADLGFGYWDDKSYQVPFTVDEAGKYSFAFLLCSGGGAGAQIPVRIDDGETYNVVASGAWNNYIPQTFYGMNDIYLEAGEHVFHLIRPKEGSTHYYFGFQYTSEALQPENLTRTTTLPVEFADATYVSIGVEGKRDNPSAGITIYGEDDGNVNYQPGGAQQELGGSCALKADTLYKFNISVDKTGEYAFCFKISAAGAGAGLSTILVDGEQTWATAISPGGIAWPKHEFFSTVSVVLEKGDHVVEIQKTSATTYYHGFYYYMQPQNIRDFAVTMTTTATDEFTTPVFPISTVAFADYIDANVNRGLERLATGNAGTYQFAGGPDGFGTPYVSMGVDPDVYYMASFTVPYSGIYSFRFDFVTDGGGRGAYVSVDDSEGYFVNMAAGYSDANGVIMRHGYGMYVELTKGTHVFKLWKNDQGGQAYAYSFAYTLVEKYADEEGEGGDADGIYTGDVVVLPNTNATVPGEALGQPNMNAINPVDAPAANLGEVPASAPAASVPAPAPKQPYVPVRKPVAPGRPGNHASTPARPA